MSVKRLGQRAAIAVVSFCAAVVSPFVPPVQAQTNGLITPVAVGEREALVALPHDYDPALTYPVMLVFGGLGASPEDMAATSGFHDGANAIVAYARGEADTWAGAPYSARSMEQDVAFSRQLVETLAVGHLVDRSRVYAVGHSNGGAFAAALACRAPDLVAGAVSVSGMFYAGVDAGCAAASVPVMFIHAANDDVARPEGGVRHNAPFDALGQVVDRWILRNGCLPEATERWTSAPGATARAVNGCRAETEILESPTAGHQWPDYATHEAWNFLSRQVR